MINKKIKKKKLITQNKRNKIINRKYVLTIKTLFKLLVLRIENFKNNILNNENSFIKKQEIVGFTSKLYSIIDKAVKKKIIHKNRAAKKKSQIIKISRVFLNLF